MYIMNRIVFFLSRLTVLFVCINITVQCSLADEFEEVGIIKKMPCMYLLVNSLKLGDCVVVQNEQLLLDLFGKEGLEDSFFSDIDFEKQTLILCLMDYPYQVSTIDYQLLKNKQGECKLMLDICGIATKPDVFLCGVVVSKVDKLSVVEVVKKECIL